MMDLIYGKATSTLVWLGDESEDSELVIAKFASIKRKEDFENVSEAENEAIGRILMRPWFSGVWVVQEFSLAKSVVVQCRSMSFQWPPIKKCSLYYTNKGSAFLCFLTKFFSARIDRGVPFFLFLKCLSLLSKNS